MCHRLAFYHQLSEGRDRHIPLCFPSSGSCTEITSQPPFPQRGQPQHPPPVLRTRLQPCLPSPKHFQTFLSLYPRPPPRTVSPEGGRRGAASSPISLSQSSWCMVCAAEPACRRTHTLADPTCPTHPHQRPKKPHGPPQTPSTEGPGAAQPPPALTPARSAPKRNGDGRRPR